MILMGAYGEAPRERTSFSYPPCRRQCLLSREGRRASMSEPGKKVLVWGLTSNVGGLEMVVKNYVGRISPSDVRFDFVTTHESMAFEDWVLELGSEVLYLPSRSKDRDWLQARHIDRFSSECLAHMMPFGSTTADGANLDILVKAKKVGVPRRIAHAHNTRDIADGQVRILRHKANRDPHCLAGHGLSGRARWRRLSGASTNHQLESQRFRVVRNSRGRRSLLVRRRDKNAHAQTAEARRPAYLHQRRQARSSEEPGLSP